MDRENALKGANFVIDMVLDYEGKNIELLKNCKPSQWLRFLKYGPKAVDIYRKYGVFPIGDTASIGGGACGWLHDTEDVKERFLDDPALWQDRYFRTFDTSVKNLWEKIEDPNANVKELFGSVASDEPTIPTIERLAFEAEHKVIVNIMNTGSFVPYIRPII